MITALPAAGRLEFPHRDAYGMVSFVLRQRKK